jgi:hypothetical protein
MIERVGSMAAEDAPPGLCRWCAPEIRFTRQHAETLPVTPLRALEISAKAARSVSLTVTLENPRKPPSLLAAATACATSCSQALKTVACSVVS